MNHLFKIHAIQWSENRDGHLMKTDLLVLLRKTIPCLEPNLTAARSKQYSTVAPHS